MIISKNWTSLDSIMGIWKFHVLLIPSLETSVPIIVLNIHCRACLGDIIQYPIKICLYHNACCLNLTLPHKIKYNPKQLSRLIVTTKVLVILNISVV